MRRFISGWITMSAVVFAATAVQAQTLVVDEIRVPYPPGDAATVDRGPYAAVPPPGAMHGHGGYDEAVPPFEVVRLVRSMGYEPLGAPVRRRWVYTISTINPDGYDGRVVLDARTGRIMRFIPADVSDDEVVGAYGPPGLPPPPPSIQKMNARTSLRPPLPVPHVASRTASHTPPATTAKPEPHAVGAAPPPQLSASAQTKPAEVKAAETKPLEAKPSVQLQPTQEMPPVQGLD